jgi:mono/diheme cytochrome c family protein
MKQMFQWFSGAFLSVVLVGCGSLSLAADVTPPPNYQPAQQSSAQQVETVSTAFPLLPPDPIEGQAIYTQKCLPCHGASGMGDGPQSGNLPEPPPALGSREVASAARPSDWYDLVTVGRLEKFMPGFTESLNDRQRWDVVAYVFTLSTSQAELEQGKAVYDQNCASCHGEAGEGGENAPDWSQQDRLAMFSALELEAVVANGQGSMPAYADQLSADDRSAAVSYVRSLTFAGAGAPGDQQAAENQSGENRPEAQATPVEAAAVPEANPSAERTITVRGSITSMGGEIVPEGLTVTLFGFAGMDQVSETSTVSAADGSYEFKDVQVNEDMAYMVTVDKGGTSFNSDILHSADVMGDTVELPVTIFESTSDASSLNADRLHIFFDFSQADVVQVVELFIVTNPSGMLVVPVSDSQPALAFTLPAGAANLQFDGGSLGDRFVAMEGGFGDLSPIQPEPQQHQVLFSYELPYPRKLDLNIPLPMDVSAAVVMLPPGMIKLESDQLMAAGERDVQGMTFQLFTASNLPAGSNLQINLSGKVDSSSPSASGNLSGLIIGLGAFGLVLVGAGLWFFQQRRAPVEEVEDETIPVADETEDDLLDAILALDDLYKAGNLPVEAYQQRRAELKDRLRMLHEGK